MFMLISAALLAVGAIQAPPFPTATVTLAAPIFVAPGAKVPLRVAAKGTFLHVLKEDVDWVEVEFQDPQYGRRVGWMEARFLSISRPALQPMDLSVAKASAAARPSAEPGAIQEKPDSPISGRVSAGARHSQTRKGFWFNVGLGAGSLGCDNCTGRANGLSGGLSLGGRINDKWLVGVGTTGLAYLGPTAQPLRKTTVAIRPGLAQRFRAVVIPFIPSAPFIPPLRGLLLTYR